MASTQLFFDILARDKASATFNKVAAAADQLGKRTDRAGRSQQAFGKVVRWTGGMLSVYGVGQYLKSSLQEYAKAEAAQNKLGIAYQRFPRMQNVTIASFKALNKQLMLKTQFDDDDAAAMQANLARFGVTGREIQKLTPLVADLAQAQGTDLVTAGAAMGKAFLGNTRALKALGINYTATGNRAKDYRNIVELLNKKVGGESTKAAGTTAVKLKQMENQWGELKETVGAAVLPAFSRFVEVAGPAITDFAALIEENLPEIEQAFQDVWDKARGFGRGLKKVWDGFQSIPPDVRNVLLAMAGGTWALGKVKGSAFGQGLGSIFKGLKSMVVTASVVNVNGPGGKPIPGGKAGPGSVLPAVFNPVTIAAAAAGLAFLANFNAYRNGEGRPVPVPGPGGGGGLPIDPFNTPRVSSGNRSADEADRWERAKEALKGYAAAVDQATAADRMNRRGLNARGQTLKESMAEYKRNVDQASAADRNRRKGLTDVGKATDEAGRKTRSLGKEVSGLPKSKKIKVDEDGAARSRKRVKDLDGATRSLRGKRVRVDEDGAEKSKKRVRDLDGQVKSLKGKRVKVDAETGTAKSRLDGIIGALNTVNGMQANAVVNIESHFTKSAAGGGYISGPGTSTSDSIPARLSNGEYVVKAAAVRRYGVAFLDAVNGMALTGMRKGGWPKPPTKPKDPGSDASKAARKSYEKRYDRYEKAMARYEPIREAKQSAAEARRQARLLAAMSRRGISADSSIASYLSGMSSQAALKLLGNRKMTNPALQGLANQANAISNAQQAIANQQQAQADAAQAQADAAAEAAQRQTDAEDAALDRVNTLRDAVDGLAGSYRSFASIATTSVTDVSDAQSKLADANGEIVAAQKAMDIAGSDQERAVAATRLAKALEEQATAQQNLATAGRPTTSTIRANMFSKLQKLRDFASNVKKLKANGLNAVTLAELLQMGPEQGYEFSQALIDGGLGDINDLQSQITGTAADLGMFQYATDAASSVLTGTAAAQAAGLVTGGIVMAPAPVTVSIDGNAIANALIAYKRQNGGAIPGLL